MILTNRGAGGDTQTAWDFYRRVRPQFVGWNHVVLTFQTDPDRERSSEQAGLENKIVQFVDDGGNVLELEGINFGYAGHAPQELLENLMREGFCDGIGIRRKILNRTGRQDYPVKIVRSDGDLTI